MNTFYVVCTVISICATFTINNQLLLLCLSISIRLLLYSTPIFRVEYYSFYKTFYPQWRDFCEERVMCTTHAWNCKHSRIFRDFFLWAKDDVIFLLLLQSFVKKIVNMIFQIKLPSCFANDSVEYKCYVPNSIR